MDELAHVLYTGAIFRIINLKRKILPKIKVWQGILWGLFPDLLAFTIPSIVLLYNLILATITKSSNATNENVAHQLFSNSSPLFTFTMSLYTLGHSIIIFLIIFGITYLIFKKPTWVMAGWLIHILIDIPSHSGYWATKFLWPISNVSLEGYAWWTNGKLVLISYILILIIYMYLFYINKKKKIQSKFIITKTKYKRK
jgi:hypothetical protein